jgi:twitching motility protein PilT
MENRDYEIRDTIEAGKEYYKSQSFDQSLLDLYNQGVISKEKAMENATSASDLELKINGLSSGKISAEPNGRSKQESVAPNFDDVFGLK